MSSGPAANPSHSIAVIGGGLIGLSAAWRLVQAGFRVTVFDKGRFAREASWAGAGMLSPGGEAAGPSLLAQQLVESRLLYPAFVRELEQVSSCTIDYQECGALELSYSEEEFATLEACAEHRAIAGIPSKPLAREQVAKFWPRVQVDNLAGARFYRNDALVDPRGLIDTLETVCCAIGVTIEPHCAISHIAIADDSAILETAHGSQIFTAAIIAAGAWSSRIPVSGVPSLPACEPVKGHLIGYYQPEQTCNTILRHGHTYLLQRANGLLIVGASIEHVDFDRSVDPAIAAHLALEAGLVLPHLTETTPSETWIGFRPSGDVPHVGAWHSPHLYLAYGHFRNGILLAPLTARQIATAVSANWQKS